jgi:hypothetical protein
MIYAFLMETRPSVFASGDLDRAMTTSPFASSSGSSQVPVMPGSKDGRGCADHDQPYTFGRRPRGVAPFPFTTRQYARLLALRGRVADGLAGTDDLDVTGLTRHQAQAQAGSMSPRLFSPCAVCGAVVAGAYYRQAATTCPKCAQDGGRDQAARAILLTAGVIQLVAESQIELDEAA